MLSHLKKDILDLEEEETLNLAKATAAAASFFVTMHWNSFGNLKRK